MENKTGCLVISLDFELLWGVRDKKTIESYGKNINAVHKIVPRLLQMFSQFGIKTTFSTVGFLFAHTKEEILQHTPKIRPSYLDKNLSPYNGHFELVKSTWEEDPYHFAPELLSKIKEDNRHAIGTHTFSHYYCQEPNQTLKEFQSDIEAARSISINNGIEIKSIIFPRNQCNDQYLEVCKKLGIESYRGNEKNWAFRGDKRKPNRYLAKLRRLYRGLDAYVNLSGHHCYSWDEVEEKKILYNIPSSRLLRAYSKRLNLLENFKIQRIKRSMTYAAKNKLIYHLWWHPHNFGNNMDENFKNLEKILTHYQHLNHKYDFHSHSMESLIAQIKK